MLIRVFSFLFILLLVPDLVAQDAGDGRFLKFPGSHSTRSSGGRFILEGTNSIRNLDLGCWAEEVAAKVERAIADELPYGESLIIRIIAVDDASMKGVGRVVAEESVEGGVLTQRLKFYNYEKVEIAEANEALCRLLLDGLVASLHSKQNKEDIAHVPVTLQTNSVPEWLWQGLSRYIYQDLGKRCRCSPDGLEKGAAQTFP